MHCVFAGTIALQWSIPSKDTPCPLGGCCVHFQTSNLPFEGAIFLIDKPMFLHSIQYYWHTASLSKVQHVWNCAHYWNTALSLLTTEYSHVWKHNLITYEEAAFLENWTTFVRHVYYSPWSAQPSFTLISRDNSHLKFFFNAIQREWFL